MCLFTQDVASIQLQSSAREIKKIITQHVWDPFSLLPNMHVSGNTVPDVFPRVDFVEGVRTVSGQGDPAIQEGWLLIFARLMHLRPIEPLLEATGVLLLPQHGHLNVGTEVSWARTAPGEQPSFKPRLGLESYPRTGHRTVMGREFSAVITSYQNWAL